MALTEETKQFIQQQVELREDESKKLRIDMLTHQNELLELKGQVKDLIQQQEKALQELLRYKRLLQLLSGLLLGGSILGFGVYWNYMNGRMDREIAARAIKTDRVTLAISSAYSSEWRRALLLLDKVWPPNTNSAEFDPDFRSFLFVNYIWILGQIQEMQPDGTWVGAAQWKRLNDDPAFQQEFITGVDRAHDSDLNNSLGFCTLKYADSANLIPTARVYFQRSLDNAGSVQKKAPSFFALAMIDLIDGDQKGAAENLKKAEELDPSNYLISDRIIYRNTFVNSTEFQIWAGVSKRVKSRDFTKIYDELLMSLKESNKKKPG